MKIFDLIKRPTLTAALGKKGHVLIASTDVPENRKFQLELQHQGYKVHTTTRFDEVLRISAADREITVVLLDMDLSGKNSEGQITQLKKILKPNAVLILMAEYSLESMTLAVCTGCNEFLAKPVGVSEIAAVLKRAGQVNRKAVGATGS